MGGHGALVCALRNPGRYASVSAFAPIASAPHCPWGEKALAGYLGPDRERWKSYDASALARAARFEGTILVDQGAADRFLAEQLKPELLASRLPREPAPGCSCGCTTGYDHSYYFISTFMEDHLRHHARSLCN